MQSRSAHDPGRVIAVDLESMYEPRNKCILQTTEHREARPSLAKLARRGPVVTLTACRDTGRREWTRMGDPASPGSETKRPNSLPWRGDTLLLDTGAWVCQHQRSLHVSSRIFRLSTRPRPRPNSRSFPAVISIRPKSYYVLCKRQRMPSWLPRWLPAAAWRRAAGDGMV